MTLFGLLNVHKPAGVTSRDVVDRVARLVRPAKAGHAGTLDPLATGVLVVGVGVATRLVEYVQRMPKRYTGTFLLGRESPTEDVEGEVTLVPDAPQPTLADVERAAAGFVGPIQQRPPAFSALKVAGRRAYDLARKGQAVELEPREVVIHALHVAAYAYPELTLEIECGSGTYVRSLGRDLATALGTAAVMSALVRTAIGSFRLENAVRPEDLRAETVADRLLPPEMAVACLPRLDLSASEAIRIGHGLAIERAEAGQAAEWAAFDLHGRLISILALRPDGLLTPTRNFPPETGS